MRRMMVLVVALMVLVAAAGTAHAGGWYGGSRYPAPPPRQEGGAYQQGGYAPPSPPRHSPQGRPYLVLHGGVFEPNDDSEGLGGYDTGWNIDVGFGSRLSAFLAVEGNLGSYGAEDAGDELRVVPVTVGARFILPGSYFEPYVGGGLGLYFASLEEAAVPPDYSGMDDSATTAGGYFSMGVDTWINPVMALNVEGKYHFAGAEFTSRAGNDFDVDVSGWTVNVGVRFEF